MREYSACGAHKMRTGTVAAPPDTHLKHNSIMSRPAAERTLWLLEARGDW